MGSREDKQMAQKEYAFKNLVFEGGGMKGLAYAGALSVLQERNILKDITRIAGTSAGAITAALVALGFTPQEIEQTLSVTDFAQFKDDSFFKIVNIIRLIREYGWFKGNSFKQWFTAQVAKKFSPELTFGQLANMQGAQGTKALYIIGTDVNLKSEIIFSHETSPDMKIVEAVRISMSIPLFFRAVHQNTDVLVDGGIYYNYPLNLFDDPKYLSDKENGIRITKDKVFYNKETLGFRVDTPEEISEQKFKKQRIPDKINSFKEYLSALIGGLVDLANKRHLSEYDWHRTIYINALGVSTTAFNLPEETKRALINQGQSDTKKYFDWFDASRGVEKPLNK